MLKLARLSEVHVERVKTLLQIAELRQHAPQTHFEIGGSVSLAARHLQHRAKGCGARIPREHEIRTGAKGVVSLLARQIVRCVCDDNKGCRRQRVITEPVEKGIPWKIEPIPRQDQNVWSVGLDSRKSGARRFNALNAMPGSIETGQHMNAAPHQQHPQNGP
ncbi:MAG: hypothetical protein AAFY97_05225 [Pseudomonadota bacterium]